MALSKKANPEYWALKDRLDNWGHIVTRLMPIIILPTLGFGGAFIGWQLFSSYGLLIGFATGGMMAQVICLTFWNKKLGFLMFSNERCQSCQDPLAQWHLIRIRLDDICRQCGNDNRIDIHEQ